MVCPTSVGGAPSVTSHVRSSTVAPAYGTSHLYPPPQGNFQQALRINVDLELNNIMAMGTEVQAGHVNRLQVIMAC